MSIKLSNLLRVMFLIGIILAGISLFFDWYLFQARDQYGNLVVYWGYNPIFSWYSIFEEGSIFNELYTPITEPIPLTIIIVFVIILVISMIGVFRTPQRFFAYSLVFSLLLMGFFIVIYPAFYLIPYRYYVPWVSYYDPELQLTFSYSMELGYLMQAVSFIFVFPYSIFYYKLSNTHEQTSSSSQELVDQYIQTIQEPIDFDKLIQEEELEMTHKFSLNGSKNKTLGSKKSFIKNNKNLIKT